ncbi:hypothetical protein [Streptacidiphilus monticola]|uniref:50S ribosomal protein L32 n=1 Tax=Streptacidiphilus monticola TaxID=2161674 RepID=A0ABW1G678_9ACTN
MRNSKRHSSRKHSASLKGRQLPAAAPQVRVRHGAGAFGPSALDLPRRMFEF